MIYECNLVNQIKGKQGNEKTEKKITKLVGKGIVEIPTIGYPLIISIYIYI